LMMHRGQLVGGPRCPHWRKRATEACAQAAEQLAYPEARRIMLEIAASYPRLAHSTHERTKVVALVEGLTHALPGRADFGS